VENEILRETWIFGAFSLSPDAESGVFVPEQLIVSLLP
jgi:hypothetical protein